MLIVNYILVFLIGAGAGMLALIWWLANRALGLGT